MTPALRSMNTIEIFSSFSEESILAVVAFLGAGAFYMLRLTKIMRTRIQEFEDRDLDGRDAFKSDVNILHDIEGRIRTGYQYAKDQVEQELVEYELAAFALNPRLKQINTKIEDSSKKDQIMMEDLRHRIQVVSSMVQASPTKGNSLASVRSALPQAIQIVNQMQQSMAEQHSKINQMNGDIHMIKKGHGVE